MPEVESNTHAMLVSGAGLAAAGEALVGTITLPAGGPWIVHHVFGQVVQQTASAAELVGGHYHFEVASGDFTPNPAPSRFPAREHSSALGATIDRGASQLNLFPVDWEAAGKAVVNLWGFNNVANTGIPLWNIGMIFGKSRPEVRPAKFVDQVRTTIAAAADTAIGTITLAEKATKITGICGILNQTGVLVTAEELTGFFRLQSDDIKLAPMQLPFNCVYGAGLGATISGGGDRTITFIPVDIPVVGGARIAANVDLITAVTNAADVAIYLAYE